MTRSTERGFVSTRSVSEASAAAFVALIVWWAGVSYIDGLLAGLLPYDRYATAALFYAEAFYPGIPGMILAEVLYAINVDAVFGGATFAIGLFGWIIVLSLVVGGVAAWYAADRDVPPAVVAVVAVGGLFVFFTVVEAAGTLVG